MIDKNTLRYRQSTMAVVTNDDGKILLVQKDNYQDNEWDFPGGGVEENEIPEQAVLRELEEELGASKFEIIAKSKTVDQYEWPDNVIERKFQELGKTWRGQQRTQFLIKFTGVNTDIVFPKSEIRQTLWVLPKELYKYFIFPKQFEKAKKLLEEFSQR